MTLEEKPTTNVDRAAWGEIALTAYRAGHKASPDDAEAITDLVRDLMHTARGKGIDPLGALRNAELSFIAEEADGVNDNG